MSRIRRPRPVSPALDGAGGVAGTRGISTAALLLALLGLAGPVPAPAQENASPPPGGEVREGTPRIRFDRRLHDFGQAVSGQELRTTFTFRNEGDGELIIYRLAAG